MFLFIIHHNYSMRFSNKEQVVRFASVGVALILEGYMLWYQYWYLFCALLFLLVFGLVWFTVVDSVISKNFFMYCVTPVLFVFAVMGFITLVEVEVVKHMSALGASFLIWLYMHALYLFNFNFEKYSDKSIENISNYTNLITFFLMGIILFAAYTLVAVPFWILVGVVVVVSFLIGTQWAWAAQVSSIKTLVYTMVITLMILELFWAIAFLPTDFYVAGFLLTVSYYVMWGILKSSVYAILTPKLLRRYLTVAVIATCVVVMTTVWY